MVPSLHSAGAGSESETYCCTSQPSYQPPHHNICDPGVTTTTCWPKSVVASVVPEQRQHPRRTSTSAVSRLGCPPPFVRQCDRKVNFVDRFVGMLMNAFQFEKCITQNLDLDSSAQIVEAIWPLSSVRCRTEAGHKGVLPLRTFIKETLRRSGTRYSTLQVALYYLILIKPHVPKHDFTMEQPEDTHSIRALQCGRRMFLAALMLASKYLQDWNYSARAWTKISGLDTQEINQNEMAFLLAVNWRLHISDEIFYRWTDIVLKYTPSHPPSPGALPTSWKLVILDLNPELDNVEGISSPASAKATIQIISASSTKSFPKRMYGFESESNESTTTPRYYTPTKPTPALGRLPTPRLTPQSIGFSTPIVSAQASMVYGTQSMEKWPGQSTMSPQGITFPRWSALEDSVSSMSSPDSMVSDNALTRSCVAVHFCSIIMP
jgi:PHO85 cyclin-5